MQHFTRSLWWSAVIGMAGFITGCQFGSPCRELTGQWTNKEGQFFVFEPNGHAYWLVKFGSEFDTFPIRYHYDCKKNPLRLDLTGFKAGPLTGKTLYGILEWTSDTSFRFDGEPGLSPDVRPETFNSEQTQRFLLDKTE
mgnify:CR=1 FL=1